MPKFIMMVGLPASGKSTYAHNLHMPVVSSDEIRKAFGYSQKEHDKTFKEVRLQIHLLAQSGKSFVYDATNLHRKYRMQILDIVSAYDPDYTCECIVMATPFLECKNRNAERTKDKVPDEVLEKMLRYFQVPSCYEGWDKVEIVRTYSAARELLSYKQAIDFKQDNPHHTLTLGYHMLAAADFGTRLAIEGQRSDIEVASIAEILKYHDIGKLKTKKFENAKGEPTEFAHYYGHENVGAYYAMCQDIKIKKPILEPLELAFGIEWHMRPTLVWNNPQAKKATQRDFNFLPQETVDILKIIGFADREAH